LLSALLWVSLSLNQTYEIDKSIPVKINVNKPFAVSGNVPLYLDAKFRGAGWQLIRLITSLNLEFNYALNSRFNEPTVILTRQQLIDNLGLSQGLTISRVYPESIYVKVDKYVERYVKLVPRARIECMNGYQVVGKLILDPDSIIVGGAPDVLNPLKSLPTEELYMNNINAGFSRIVKITDTLSNIISKSETYIKLTASVELTAEKDYHSLGIKVLNIPEDKEVLLIPQDIDIVLKGGVKQLASLDTSLITPSLSFNDILRDTTGAVTPRFGLPEGTTIISMKPDRIQYVIKKKY